MSSPRNARPAMLLLMFLAVALLWAADPGLRAATRDRAETSASPATSTYTAPAGAAAAAEPQEATKPTATQKAQQTTVTDVAGRKHVLMKKVTQAERQAAADRLKAAVAAAGVRAPQRDPMGDPFPVTPGAIPRSELLVGPNGQLIPDYSGLTANWAYSPTPTTAAGVPVSVGYALVPQQYPTDGVNVFGVVPTPLTAGTLMSFRTYNDPATYPWVPDKSFRAFVLRPTGVLNQYLIVFDSGFLFVPPVAVGAVQDFPIAGGFPVNNGDLIGWFGLGIPYTPGTGAPIYWPVPNPPYQGSTITLGDPVNFPVYPEARTYSFGATVAGSGPATGGIRKFVDRLAGLGPSGANNLGQYIPVAVADTTTYPGSDYYAIELGEYSEKMHSDLPPTRLRGYRQTNMGGTPFHYLGPLIIAQKGRPVRITFANHLPTGVAGNLFLPVDASVMGAGPGPNVSDATRIATQPNELCAAGPGQAVPAGCYTQNRATIHLHGGVTPWISDGTTHQWITPAGEAEYPHGVSVYNVPDMPDPGVPAVPGVQTFYYTNDESARLMFYHDHAAGITRLNVYAGVAAGYLLTDPTEQALLAPGKPLAGVGYGIPLVIQDKTFVDAANIGVQDPTWNWGTGAVSSYTDPNGVSMPLRAPVTGDLWWPHVYQPAQNPYDLSGYNATGRWNYGPWFFPPTTGIPYGPVDNPYYDCGTGGPCLNPAQPPGVPGTPNPSWGAEAFLDTPVINGTAYPTVTVDPKAYRFRILNAAHDRFWNLQLYKADVTVPPGCLTCAGETEVKMVIAAPNTGLPANWPQDGRPGGAPDPLSAGPSFIQIGTEGGFLPKPVVVPNQPVIWNYDPLTFSFGNVSDHALLLGPAERADVIVDFSAYAGQTLILYNDAPAAFPALDPRNDYYTGNPAQFDTGGTWSTLPGFGPNVRTIMQIKVAAGAGTAFDVPGLMAAWAPGQTVLPFTPAGVFEHGQDQIIVGQAAYNGVYTVNPTFPSTAPWWGIGSIFNSNVSFETVQGVNTVILAGDKAIHDEMGATFDDYGRMKASLGVSMPNPTPNTANFIMQSYADPATEVIKLSDVVTPIGTPLLDGTQIWRMNHNGVDTHPIHFHLFSVQLLNRVGWDGAYRLPDATELGWKDTVRVSPLEDTYVALRPIAPRGATLPFKVPNSFRPLEPALPIGSALGFTNVDPLGNPITPGVTNEVYNFGWEYVWHCHILSHEENDMMRAVVFTETPETPSNLISPSRTVAGVNLTWMDHSVSATSFTLQRATDSGFTAGLTTFIVPVSQCANQLGCTWAYTDTSAAPTVPYYYRVSASNTVGSGVPNYPTITTDSPWAVSPLIAAVAAPAVNAPTNLAATIFSTTQIQLTWTDASNNENNFAVWRQTNGGAFTQVGTVNRSASQRTATGGTVTFNSTGLVAGNTYAYYVVAWNTVPNPDVSSLPSSTVTVSFTAPAAPTQLVGFGNRIPGNNRNDVIALTWVDNAVNESGFLVQRCQGVCGAGGAWTSINPLLPANSTAYSETQSRTFDWSYRVRATNALGNSAFSNIVTVITP